MFSTRSLSLQRYLLLAVIILLGAYAIRMVALSQTSFSIDEAYTMDTIDKTLYGEGFVAGMRDRFVHMPLFFASLFLYPPPHSDFSIRIPSVLWSMIAIAIAMRIVTHIYRTPRFALLAGLLLAINLFDITNARTARMYPISNALVATSSYLFLRYISNPKNRKLQWYGEYFISMLAYLTHVATLVIPAAQGLTWVRRFFEGKASIGRILYWLTLQLILMLPAALWAIAVFNNQDTAVEWIEPPTIEAAFRVLESLILGGETGQTAMLLLPLYMLPLILFFVFFKRIKHWQYWLGLTLIPFAGLFVISLIKSIFVHRYLGVALFAYVIIIVISYKALMDYVLSHQRRIGVLFVSAVLLAHIAASLLFTVRFYRIDYFSGNFVKQAAAYIVEHGEEGDAIWYQNTASHIGHYLPDDKFIVIVDLFDVKDEYVETGHFPYDRVWVIDISGIWTDTDLVEREPDFEDWGTIVFLVDANGT